MSVEGCLDRVTPDVESAEKVIMPIYTEADACCAYKWQLVGGTRMAIRALRQDQDSRLFHCCGGCILSAAVCLMRTVVPDKLL